MPSAPKPDRFSYPLGREDKPSAVKQLKKDQSGYELSGVLLDKNWLAKPKDEIFDVFSNGLGRSSQPYVDYVRTGRIERNGASLRLPIATIGQIKTISSREIESLRAIRRLTQSYLAGSNTGPTPLGLAVFGQPGTGKSFTVKSVFKTLKGLSKELIEGSFIECNLSGLSGPEDISNVFQRARDFRLEGKVPVMFFDEFDCRVGESDFFWLKHFLAPLQDGVFTSGHMTHPIGKSIFVFAGGVSHSFKKFVDQFPAEAAPDMLKGRDFLSRLQGHIDVEGLWPTDTDGKLVADPDGNFFGNHDFRKYVMRRAIILRDILSRRAQRIFNTINGAEVANIDENIVKAFLREREYRHGIRSIEAVIRMSSVDSMPRFTPECLPTRSKLRCTSRRSSTTERSDSRPWSKADSAIALRRRPARHRIDPAPLESRLSNSATAICVVDGDRNLLSRRCMSYRDLQTKLKSPTSATRLTLEQVIAYIADDELVEVTPKSIRLHKRQLDATERRKGGPGAPRSRSAEGTRRSSLPCRSPSLWITRRTSFGGDRSTAWSA